MDASSLRLARTFVLALICALAFVIRLFAVVRYEGIVHEFVSSDRLLCVCSLGTQRASALCLALRRALL